MNQIGCVLTFKPGVDPNEIKRRLSALEDIADATAYGPNENRPNAVIGRNGSVVTELRKFNPDHGCPVWYVP